MEDFKKALNKFTEVNASKNVEPRSDEELFLQEFQSVNLGKTVNI